MAFDFAKRQRDIREYEASQFVAELIGQAQTILNVGPSWGRDYYELTKRGKHVINMDIAPQKHLRRMVIADASQKLPFATGYFDAVLLGDVLEHLIEDWVTLQESRRVLKDDGRLVVTVPLYHDDPPYHIRIHSPKSILRLLTAAGFSAERVIYRGGWIRVPRIVHAVRKCLSVIRMDAAWYRFAILCDRWLGQQNWFAPFAKGAYILAHKGEQLDWRRINRETFQHFDHS